MPSGECSAAPRSTHVWWVFLHPWTLFTIPAIPFPSATDQTDWPRPGFASCAVGKGMVDLCFPNAFPEFLAARDNG